MLTTHTFGGTQRTHNTPHSLPSSCSRSSSRQIRSGVAALSSSSPGSGVLSSGSRCRGRWGPDMELSGSLSSSRQAPDALTYISLSQTVREIERVSEGEREWVRARGMGWAGGGGAERRGSLKNAWEETGGETGIVKCMATLNKEKCKTKAGCEDGGGGGETEYRREFK